MKSLSLASIVAALLIAGPAWAQDRHDSVVMMVDVSQTTSGRDQVAEAKTILENMNKRFPAYVQDGGLMVFGNQQTPSTAWTLPVGDYDKQAMDRALSSVEEGQGPTPIGFSLNEAEAGVDQARGKTALIIVSDGKDNGQADPAEVVREMKQKHGADLCVFTIALGDDESGSDLLSALVSAGQCGKTYRASALRSDSEVQALVDYIFPPMDAPPPQDSDGDGVFDPDDECPGTLRGARVDARGCWVIENIRFDTGKAEIKPQYHSDLDDVAQVLELNPGIVVVVVGHTDAQGSDEMNQDLSERRAQSVVDYLIVKGIEAARISASGKGESVPMADNETVEGRALNRRIEIEVK